MRLLDRHTAFLKPTEAQKKEKEQREKKRAEEVSQIRENAIACMNSPLFKNYFERLNNAQSLYLDAFLQIDLTAPNAILKAMELQQEIKAHAFLLIELTKDASLPTDIPSKKN